MSSCLTGGGRACSIDLEILKSPSTSSWTSHSSSPSSTLSESSNSPLSISTRKPRTPRKRLNQTYNEAATLLSTACPIIFPIRHHLRKPCKFTKPNTNFFNEPSELLLPFRVIDDSGFLLHQPGQERPNFRISQTVANDERPCYNQVENDSLSLCDGYEEDFDAESMLDEEIDEGVDSIMGSLSVNSDSAEESNVGTISGLTNTWYGHLMGLAFGGNFDLGATVGRGVRAMRHVDEEDDWWRFPPVNVIDISIKLNKVTTTDKKKKKIEKPVEKSSELPKENPLLPKKLLLKLNYEEVLSAWSGRGTPFFEEISRHENDLHARMAGIDLFSETANGGLGEASAPRYKEKRRTRLSFDRNINDARRPTTKGRFVRRPNSPTE